MVLKQIQELLHNHDCVIIPDFGGLIAHYASSKIHPVKHTFAPPSKKIAFNEKLKHNDGLLISNLAQHLHIQTEDARRMVAEFVGGLQTELARNQQCELQGIGIFRYNAEQKLEFEYLEADNFLAQSFGLPELEARPIVPAEAAVLRTMREKVRRPEAPVTGGPIRRTSRRMASAAGTILAGGLTVALVYFVTLQTDYNLSSLNPVSLFSGKADRQPATEETVAFSEEKVMPAPLEAFDDLPVTPEEISVSAVEADYNDFEKFTAEAPTAITKVPLREIGLNGSENAIENTGKTTESNSETAFEVPVTANKEVKTFAKSPAEKTVAKPAEKVAGPVKTNTGGGTIKAAKDRYFVISGGYSSKENAERSQLDLKAKGAVSEVILPMAGSKLHRVSVAEFETMEQASAKLPELRAKFGDALWIMHY